MHSSDHDIFPLIGSSRKKGNIENKSKKERQNSNPYPLNRKKAILTDQARRGGQQAKVKWDAVVRGK